MEKLPLPLSGFGLVHRDQGEVLDTSNDSDYGFIVGVDFNPDELQSSSRFSISTDIGKSFLRRTA